MKTPTIVKKLAGKNFYVYIYKLESPKYYQGLKDPATIGVGYIGPDVRDGIQAIQRAIAQAKEDGFFIKNKETCGNINNAGNRMILEAMSRFPTDLSLTIADELLTREEVVAYITEHLL